MEEVDYIVPLSVRRIKLSTDALYMAQNWGIEYSPVELQSDQENEHDLAVIIDWLGNWVNPTEGELALASPFLDYEGSVIFLKQCFILSMGWC